MNKGDNYNQVIWTIFSIAIVASFVNIYYIWTNENVLEIVKLAQIYFGFIGLVYSTLLIEGFSQKKELYKSKIRGKLNYISARWIFEFFILLPLLLIYNFSIFNITNPPSMIMYSIFILMMLITIIVIINWIRRDSVKNIKENRRGINKKKSCFDHFLYWFLVIILSLLLIFLLISI